MPGMTITGPTERGGARDRDIVGGPDPRSAVRSAAGWVRLGHRVAHVGGHRLAGAVKTTILNPSAKLRHRGAGRVEVDGRGLGHGVDLHIDDSASAAQDGVDHRLL